MPSSSKAWVPYTTGSSEASKHFHENERATEPLPTFLQRTKALFTTPGQHKQILEEEGGSYWADFHAMRTNNGKQWMAPKHLFKAERSLYFPNLSGRTLAAEEAELLPLLGTTTLIRVFSATSGEEHVHNLGEGLDLQVIDINIQSNALKYGLLKVFLGRIKALIEPERHAKYFILGTGWEKKLKVIGIINSYIGYSFLLDKSGKIRWASCGSLTKEERESLDKLSKRLKELDQ
ncbi:protein of unknown function [Taphrina deformans PYCC 5710]|uniref:Mitochondrial ATPase complex subunit ATP10 n=1 Tax=Taphrina deformans (strain PYCC 5710 / ATCC 11124 / CBS 356.35 / IMI 108563 / JCM 9778 / NBRC 8474) TaxID=1097556 RepID=R4XD72_TAPDE|nr:protein of unknown function [Taphrina deformans PYCC 5710]|eukprot:CCG83775.1 protein of unknown function [Taphrina deformans PYCC 5710]